MRRGRSFALQANPFFKVKWAEIVLVARPAIDEQEPLSTFGMELDKISVWTMDVFNPEEGGFA